MQAIETKLADLGRRVENLNLAAQSHDNSRLNDGMRSLHGEVENLRYLIENSTKRSQELYVDLDKRMQALESSGRLTRLTIDNQTAAPSGSPATATPEEETAYLKVFESLKASKHDEAIAGFQDILTKWPNGRYADNALYWIGESYYAKKDFNAALQSFQSVLDRHPNSLKAPDALFKLGLTQQQLGQADSARDSLNKVIQTYPNSSAAALARTRLEQLKTP